MIDPRIADKAPTLTTQYDPSNLELTIMFLLWIASSCLWLLS